MSRLEPQSTPEIFTLTEGRRLGLSRHRLYRSGLQIPFHRLRTTAPPEGTEGSEGSEGTEGSEAQARARFSNSDLARELSRQDPSLVISHQTAAETWGLWLPSRMRSTQIHLSRVRRQAGIPRYPGTVGHFIRPSVRDQSGDVREIDGFRITSPEWTWVDLACQRLTVDELIAAGDALLQRQDGFPRPQHVIGTNPLSTRESILDVLGRRKGSPGIRNLRIAVELIRERVDSEPESRLRSRMVADGWEEPAVNPRIRFADGWECDIDLALLTWRISLQYEGQHHFTLEKQYRSDMNRDEQVRARGWEPIRVDSEVFTRQGWQAFGFRLSTAIERQQRQASWMPFTVGP